MGRTLSDLAPRWGAKHKRKRVGRGPGSGNGTTAGRGQKGQKSRSGVSIGRGFEGGQMPLQRRLPKRGFKNPFRVEYAPVNVGRLAEVFEAGEIVDPDSLRERGVVPRNARRVKILAGGDMGCALTIKAHAFSAAAKDKIAAAGGTVEVVEVGRRGQVKAGTGGDEGAGVEQSDHSSEA